MIKNLCLCFYSYSITMSEKNMNFDDEKINKSSFYKNKKYLIYMTYMLIKYYFLKKNHMVKKAHLNAVLDIVIPIALDLYV